MLKSVTAFGRLCLVFVGGWVKVVDGVWKSLGFFGMVYGVVTGIFLGLVLGYLFFAFYLAFQPFDNLPFHEDDCIHFRFLALRVLLQAMYFLVNWVNPETRKCNFPA